MSKVAQLLLKWLTSLSGRNFGTARKSVGSALGISTSGSRATFFKKVQTHLTNNPMSYATMLAALGSYADDITEWALNHNVDDEVIVAIDKVLNASKHSMPDISYKGGDGDVDTVGGIPTSQFEQNVQIVNEARTNIEHISSILGVSPVTAIELSMRMNAVEPQHVSLFK